MAKPTNAAFGEPTYFAVRKVVPINVVDFDLPKTYGHSVYLIAFCLGHLECPESDPIAVYHYAGTRKFMWMDRFWTEVNISWRDIAKKAEVMHRQNRLSNADDLFKILQLYSNTNSPISDYSLSDNESRIFCRAMCRIYD